MTSSNVRALSFVIAALVALGCGALALNGKLDPFGIGKAVAVGLLAGYIVVLGGNAKAAVVEAGEGLDGVLSALSGSGSHPDVERAKDSVRRRQASGGGAETVAANAARGWSDRVSDARRVGGMAVYLGLAGTLIGLTVAVLGLRGLETDVERIKDQILNVVSGFGGSFTCALVGVFVSITVSNAVSRYEDAVERAERALEAHLAEKVVASFPKEEDRLAAALAQGFADSLKTSLGGLWEPLVDGVAGMDRAATQFAESGDRLATLLERADTAFATNLGALKDASDTLSSAGSEVSSAAAEMSSSVAGAARNLESVAHRIGESAETTADAAEATRQSTALLADLLESFTPALAALAALEKVMADAQREFREYRSGLSDAQEAFRRELEVSFGNALDTVRQAVEPMQRDMAELGKGFGSLSRGFDLHQKNLDALIETHNVKLNETLQRQSRPLVEATERLAEAFEKMQELLKIYDEALKDLPVEARSEAFIARVEEKYREGAAARDAAVAKELFETARTGREEFRKSMEEVQTSTGKLVEEARAVVAQGQDAERLVDKIRQEVQSVKVEVDRLKLPFWKRGRG